MDVPLSPVRDRLLASAAQLFYEHGVAATSVQDVIEVAEVSRPTLYAYFESKEELLATVLTERHQRLASDLERFESAAGHDARARLLALFDWLEEHYKDEAPRGCGFLMVAAEHAANEPLQQLVAHHKHWMWDHLRTIAEEAELANPRLVARQLMLLVDGVSGYMLASTANSVQDVSDVVAAAREAARVVIEAAASRS